MLKRWGEMKQIEEPEQRVKRKGRKKNNNIMGIMS